jgi:malic enzyme
MHEMVYNWPEDEVDVIVVTDGGRVLGLGDLGAGAMGISIGKGVLYCAAGGIEPSRLLPVMLDVGTDNEALLADEWYMGVHARRIRGEAYFELVAEFLAAVRMRWPHVLVQFEDFSSHVAAEVLRRHRREHLCFNDDIQGTGAMTLGGLLSALQTLHAEDPTKSTKLCDQKIVVAGAGSAGMGVSAMVRRWMCVHEGLTLEEASQRFWVVDQDGLITADRGDSVPLAADHALFARADTEAFSDGASLEDTVRDSGATILLGVSGQPGIFAESVVRAMAGNSDRPVIFPMSNPTSKCEATAEDVLRWTDGRAVFASGSPFDPVTMPDGRVIEVSQSNNIYAFPAIGLASVICKPSRISEEMFLAAAKRLATLVSAEDRARGLIYPPINGIREVAIQVAIEVCEKAWETGIALEERPPDLEGTIREIVYKPGYDAIVPHHGGPGPRN